MRTLKVRREDYLSHQHDFITCQAKIKALVSGFGAGKANRVSEPVLTPQGWSTIGELKIGDKVIGSDGKQIIVLNIYDQGVRNNYRVSFRDGSYSVCDLDHLWTVIKKRDKIETISLKDIQNNGYYQKAYDKRYNKDVKMPKYAVQLVEPVHFEKRILKIDPYFLGVLLGDGCFQKTAIKFTISKDSILYKLETKDIINEYKCVSKNCREFGIVSRTGEQTSDTMNALRYYGIDNHLSIDKFIPNDYLYSSIDDRLKLFQGLIDTDGYKDGDFIEYSTSSKKLAEDFLELARGLGYYAHCTSRIPKYTYKSKKRDGVENYRVYINLNKHKKFIVGIDYECSEESKCILVDSEDHLFVTRDYTVTHNTYCFLRECLKHHITNIRNDGSSSGWVVYPTLELAMDLFVDDFKDLLERKDIKYVYNEKYRTFKTGYGKIKIFTLEKPNRMIGSNLTWVGFDEFDTTNMQKSMEGYKKSLARLRGNDKGVLFIVTTPEGFKATYKIFVENASENKMIFHAKTTDNPYLPAEYIKTMRQEYDEKLIKAYIDGEFVNLKSGNVYYGFDREGNTVDNLEIDKNLPLNIFFDFNVYPLSTGYGQHKSPMDIRIIGECVLKGHSSTWDACSELKKQLPRDIDVVIYGDASGTSRSTKNLLSDYQIIDDELRGYFKSITYRVPKSNGPINDRVNCVNAKLQKRYLKINKCCVKLIRDLEQVCYTEKGDIDSSNIELTHISDALGYYVNLEFPIIKRHLNREETTYI